MLKTRSFFFLFICATSVSAQFDGDPVLKYLEGKLGSCSNEQLNKAGNDFATCINDNSEKLKRMGTLNVDIDIKQFCTLNFAKCWSDMGNPLKTCLTVETYKEYFDNHINVLTGAKTYICSDEGKHLRDFLNHGLKCFSESKTNHSLHECGQLFSDFHQKYSKHEFHLENTCRDISKLGKCAVDATDSCEDKTARNFLRNLIVKSFHDTDCRDIIAKDFPGSSSSVSAFSFLVVTAGMLALLISS